MSDSPKKSDLTELLSKPEMPPNRLIMGKPIKTQLGKSDFGFINS